MCQVNTSEQDNDVTTISGFIGINDQMDCIGVQHIIIFDALSSFLTSWFDVHAPNDEENVTLELTRDIKFSGKCLMGSQKPSSASIDFYCNFICAEIVQRVPQQLNERSSESD